MDELKNVKLKKLYLLSLAFVSGLTIMAVEISASRLIAPYYGTSTFIWTNIIGVIMIALAAGYYFGGKLADKLPDLKLLLRLILAACIFLLLTPFLISYSADLVAKILFVLNSASLIIFFGSLILVSILLFVPIFLLGIVSPFIIKLLSVIDANIGRDAGLVFSISTIGSIIGTFLPVLVFIPLIGTRKTIIVFTGLLIFVALIGLVGKKWSGFGLIILLLVFVKLPLYKQAQGAIFEDESVYQYFQVYDRDNLRYLLINEGFAAYSEISMDPNTVLTDSYFDYLNLLPYLDGNGKQQDILAIGLAGGTSSSQLHHFFSQDYDLNIDGVEIDKKLIEAGKKYFNLENESLTVHNIDGRLFLNSTDKIYNAVIIDAFSNQQYIPFHLSSLEFFQLLKEHLAKNGVVAMNVNAATSDSGLLKAITNTMNLVYEHVYILPVNRFNFLVMASNQPLNFDNLSNLNIKQELAPLVAVVIEDTQEVFYDNKFPILTDDKAPIEYLTDKMILEFIYKNKL